MNAELNAAQMSPSPGNRSTPATALARPEAYQTPAAGGDTTPGAAGQSRVNESGPAPPITLAGNVDPPQSVVPKLACTSMGTVDEMVADHTCRAASNNTRAGAPAVNPLS